MNKQAFVFDEFFDLGLEETSSPFITADTRLWGANLTLKAAIFSAFLLLVSFILSFYPSLIPLSHAILISVYFLAGVPALIESIDDLSNFDINIDVLMTLAAFSSVLIGSGMEGALLLVLFALSGAMEDAVTRKAKSAITTLSRLSPTKACVVTPEGLILERSIKDVDIGEILLVKSGQVVPLDGEVIEGASSLNLVHLTGENMPVTKIVGDEVPAGGRNLEGAFKMRVTRTSADSTLSKIIELVTQAQEARPKLQRWFDQLSRTYALTIIGLFALFAVSFPYILGIPFLGEEGSLYRALAFLIAASPCALIIAIPIAYLSAVSACARKGILLKGGVTLDSLAGCHAVALDKTGTLTTGDLSFVEIRKVAGEGTLTPEFAMAAAGALEKNAVHPIAKAILNQQDPAWNNRINLTDYKMVPGYGLEGICNCDQRAVKCKIGNPAFINPPESVLKEIDRSKSEGNQIALLQADEEYFLLIFSDTIRPKMKETISKLKERDVSIVMLTGDHVESAAKVSKEVGIDTYFAELKPEDKMRHIEELSKEKGLAMVGDGVNDAPALARATVGICMGKVGNTAAIDAADVVLLNDNIELLDWILQKAKKTQVVVRQNLLLATAAILFASIPALGGYVPLWLAVVMHEGGTVLVGLNALRLLK
jgi:heavy metal translocating P-type ATPase